MKELVQFLAQQLVNNPTAVEVKGNSGRHSIGVECAWPRKTWARDWKAGRTAKSIRTILNAVASRTNRQGGSGDHRR